MTFVTATLVYEVRTTGDDNNGGGFDSGVTSPGTDYSQQDSPQVSYTDLVISGPSSEQLTSAAHPFSSASPGNVINITGGTGFNPGLYRILSVSGATATMDRSPGAGGSAGGTGNLGGAWATVGKALSNLSGSGQLAYVKAGTYQITTSLLPPSSDTADCVSRLMGYSTTRGDQGRATIQANATSFNMMPWAGAGGGNCYSFENLIWDGNSQSGVDGPDFTGGAHVVFINCIFKNFINHFCLKTPNEPESAPSFVCLNCDFTENAFTVDNAGCIIDNSRSSVIIRNCYFADNSISSTNDGACISYAECSTITNCIFYNNTGTNMCGINTKDTGGGGYIGNNTFHSNSADGIRFPEGIHAMVYVIENNVLTNNGGYGINVDMVRDILVPYVRNNAYYNNGSGSINGISDVGAITLTGLPYVSVPTDFALNSTVGAGLSCQGAGLPGTIGASSVVGTGFQDLGALQHGGSGGSSGGTFAFVA